MNDVFGGAAVAAERNRLLYLMLTLERAAKDCIVMTGAPARDTAHALGVFCRVMENVLAQVGAGAVPDPAGAPLPSEDKPPCTMTRPA